MADDELRESERAWRATPEDQAALARLIAALRRAGRVVPEALLDARIQPARSIRSDAGVWISATLPDGTDRHVGSTRAANRDVRVPAHRSFEVITRDGRTTSDLRQIAADCARQEVERVRIVVPPGEESVSVAGAFVTPHLTHLELYCSALHEPALLAALCCALPRAPLVSLGLHDATVAGDLGGVIAARALESLRLGLPQGAVEAQLLGLGPLSRLRSLSLAGHVDPTDLDTALRLGARFIESFEPSPGLLALDLDDCGADGGLLRALARHEGLRTLRLRGLAHRIQDQDVAALRERPLEELVLPGRHLTDASLVTLASLGRLRDLDLGPGRYTAGGLQLLPLELVRLWTNPAGGLSWLPRLVNLRALGLTLDERQLSLATLAQAPNLESLELWGRHRAARPRGFAAVRKLLQLRTLVLSMPSVSLRPLEGHPTLEEIRVHGGDWGDDELACLAGIPRLRRVSIHRTPRVTGATLRVLRSCRSLQEVELDDEVFGQEAIEALRRDLPGVEVNPFA